VTGSCSTGIIAAESEGENYECEWATLIAIAVTLVGCQPTKPIPIVRFSKPGATNEQFQRDRFECIQASQIRVSGASYNAYGGSPEEGSRLEDSAPYKARIMQEDAPYSHGSDIERGGWTVRIEYEEPANKA
jgi:hypothetical protein